ncbi:hypothetical protein FQA39_LY03783 [Lamprigera yunnana]|nr:hypothetical protein FQA39_LY03783 [Lamprigera yunnana]
MKLAEEEVHQTNSEWRITLSQTLAVMAKNVLVIAFATSLAYPAMLVPSLSGNDPNELFHLNESELSWIASINLMCVPIGCLFSGMVTQPIGRKKAMQYINIPFVFCWIIFYFATELWHIYFALSVLGLFGGLVEAPLFVYVSEVTQPNLRGLLSATTSIAGALGILIQFILGSLFNWRIVALACSSVPLICFILLWFIPESPYWLISKNRIEHAKESLAWLRGWTEPKHIELEFENICKNNQVCISKNNIEERSESHADQDNDTKTLLKKIEAFVKKSFWWPFSMVSFIYFLSHFTGGTTLRIYAVKLFSTLEVPLDKYYATVLIGVAEVLGAITAVLLIRRTGKRVMVFISIAGVGISNVVIAGYAYAMDVKYLVIYDEIEQTPILDLEGFKWLPLVFFILLAYTTQCGLRILPWILIGEIYSHEVRAVSCGISGAISFILSFVSNKVFLSTISSITIAGTYWMHAAFSFFGLVVVYFTLPETEGKTLEEIIDHFSGISKLEKGIGVKGKYKTNHGNIKVLNVENLNYRFYSESNL